MNDTQLQALATALRADQDPAVIAAVAARNDTETTRLYNLASALWIWRAQVTQDEIMQNGFDWLRVDNLTVGKARIWEWLFDNEGSSINPTKANVRAGIAEAWKGTAADLAVQAAVLAHCKRPASKAEAVFTTGTGTEAVPGLTSWEGPLSVQDVSRALNEF